jgi:outer membrane protein assembly factor BamB
VRFYPLLIVAILGTALGSGQSAAAADNWPQWRGPLGTGAAPGGNPPVKWDAKTNIKWKVRIPGDGTSTPIIWGDQIFVQTAYPAKNPAVPPPNLPKGTKTIPTPTEAYQFVLMCPGRGASFAMT